MGHMYCTGWGEKHRFTPDGKMIIDMPACLEDLLDAGNYYLGKGRARWKELAVEAVFLAFAKHLEDAANRPWYWDHSGEWLASYLREAFDEVGLDEKDAESHIDIILSTMYSMHPWLWGSQLASKIGKYLVERIRNKYPELKARLARHDEDTRGSMDIYARMSVLAYGSGDSKAAEAVARSAPPLCIEGISIVVEWRDEKGEHSRCYTFTD